VGHRKARIVKKASFSDAFRFLLAECQSKIYRTLNKTKSLGKVKKVKLYKIKLLQYYIMSQTLRVHTFSDELPVVAEWVRKNTTTCLIVREEATREHFHALFETRKKLEQFRKDFRIQFPHLKGNSGYSLKNVRSQIGIEDYLCKGEYLGSLPEILEKSPSWTEEKIYTHHKSYWDRHVTEDVANKQAKNGNDSVVMVSAGRLRIRQPSAIEKIASRIRNHHTEQELNHWTNNDITRRKIIREIMDYLGESGKGFDMIILKRLYYGVLHQILPTESIHVWEDALVRFLDSER